jgi:hypothetical protein
MYNNYKEKANGIKRDSKKEKIKQGYGGICVICKYFSLTQDFKVEENLFRGILRLRGT